VRVQEWWSRPGGGVWSDRKAISQEGMSDGEEIIVKSKKLRESFAQRSTWSRMALTAPSTLLSFLPSLPPYTCRYAEKSLLYSSEHALTFTFVIPSLFSSLILLLLLLHLAHSVSHSTSFHLRGFLRRWPCSSTLAPTTAVLPGNS